MQANSVLALYIGRMIQGLGYGIIYTTAPMYLGEIASNDVRGSMATLITVMSKVVETSNYLGNKDISLCGNLCKNEFWC